MKVDAIRKHFSITKRWNYLNHAVVSPLPDFVMKSMNDFYVQRKFNGGLGYVNWFEEIERDRKDIGKVVNSSGRNISFFQNTSHAINSVSNMLPLKKGDEVIVSDLEFPSNTLPWIKLLEKGIRLRWVHNSEGVITVDDIKKVTSEKTKVIAISHVCYYNGFRVKINELSEFTNNHNIILVVDSMQSLGALEINLKTMNVDFLASNSYKWLLGPFGVAMLYTDEKWIEKVSPKDIGWYSVENIWSRDINEVDLAKSSRRFESGHPNFAGIRGLSASANFINKIGICNIEEKILSLTQKIRNGLELLNGIEILSPKANLSGITLFRIKGTKSETLVEKLRKKGIVVFSQRWKDGVGIKVSPHFYNTDNEIDSFLKIIKSLK